MSAASVYTNKSFEVPKSGQTYAYVHHPPSNVTQPTLLFLHGFPSTSYDWRNQVSYFTSLGYGVLIPDCLGYGSSSKPEAVEMYVGKSMASDIIAILDHEDIKDVVGIGHDWGTYLLTQLIIWYPKRITRCVFGSVPFHVPGKKTDVEAVNAKSKKEAGFEVLGYWKFLTKPDAGKTIYDNWETFYNLIYCSDASLWRTHFAPLGSMEHGLRTLTPSSTSKHLASWASDPTSKAHHHSSFSSPSSYTAATNWYHRAISSMGVDQERSALEAWEISSKIHIPSLMITGTKDVVCDYKHARKTMERCVIGEGKLKVVDIDAGHWIMLERGEEFNRVLREWLQETEDGVGTKARL